MAMDFDLEIVPEKEMRARSLNIGGKTGKVSKIEKAIRAKRDPAVKKTRSAGGRMSRNKGIRGEVEVCRILTELGVPSQRVIGSGAHKGADGDIKIGVRLLADGSMPERDESTAFMRGEMKNRKTNPEKPYDAIRNEDIVATIAVIPGTCPELPFQDLAQCGSTKVGLWKRAETPQGALTRRDYNQTHLAFMGLADFAKMVKEAIQARDRIADLEAHVRLLRSTN